MVFKVSRLIFMSLVLFTVPQNAPTYLPTGNETQDYIHDTPGFWTTAVGPYVSDTADQTWNRKYSSVASQTNVFVSSQNASTKTEFNGDFYSNPVTGNMPFDAGMKWGDVNALLKFQIRGILETLNLKDIIRRTNASDVCKTGLERYLNSLSDLEPWSVKMADASGKIGSGVLEGRLMSLGSYEECLKIRVDSDEDAEPIRGQFCMTVFASPLLSDLYLQDGSLNRRYLETYGEPPQWIQDFLSRAGPSLKHMSFILGTCVPSSCSDLDLAQIITHIIAPLGMTAEVAGCQVEKPMEWTKSLIVTGSVLSGVAILCILGTVADIASRVTANQGPEEEKKADHSKSPPLKLLQMFSASSNLELFVNASNSSAFGCLDGIRFLSITWVVLFHTYYSIGEYDFHKFSNILAYKEDFRESLLLAAVDNALLAICSFFFVSGFLMSYFMWRNLDMKRKKVNFVIYFLRKYWRFTPGIALTLAVYVVVAHTASGPLRNIIMDPEMANCQTNWWKTFLYIANWGNLDKMCISHTWFMACLMQFQVMGFFIIQVAFRWPAVGVLVGTTTVLGCCALVVVVAVLKHFPLPTTMVHKDIDVVLMWSNWFRFKPCYYMQSYIIGMFVGYLVLKYKDKKIKQRYQVVGWILSAMGSFYAVFGVLGPENSLEFTAFYYAFSFIAWSCSLGWFIYACVTGYGGIINRFLAWKGFHLLNNISYLIYLLHIAVFDYKMASLKELVNYGPYEMISTFLSTLAISTCLAFVGHVTIEMPLNHLEKVIFL